jgi:hypothetical protein
VVKKVSKRELLTLSLESNGSNLELQFHLNLNHLDIHVPTKVLVLRRLKMQLEEESLLTFKLILHNKTLTIFGERLNLLLMKSLVKKLEHLSMDLIQLEMNYVSQLKNGEQ